MENCKDARIGEIKITNKKGKEFVVLLDSDDWEWASKFKWCVNYWRNRVRAVQRNGPRPNRTRFFLHREVMKRKLGRDFKEEVDHADRNPLNNCRSNLRLATHEQNSRNISVRLKSKSGYTGIYWHAPAKKWHAQIHVKGKTRSLGLFTDLKRAADVREQAEKKFWGEFAPKRQKIAK